MNSELLKKYLPPHTKPAVQKNVALFEVSVKDLEAACRELYQTHALPLKTVFATDERSTDGMFKVWYVFGVPGQNMFLVPYLRLKESDSLPSLVKHIHEISWYEHEIETFFGIPLEGHPRSRPIILHENWPKNMFPLRKDFPWNERPERSQGAYHFVQMKGEGIYEIPVGPVHAGIIEPGHFRFSVAGEEIIHLEPRLGYTHKGTEKLFEVLPLSQKVKLSERVSGDSSFSHSLAFCQAIESLANLSVPDRAEKLRVVCAELERIANHLNDIGFIMMDTAFNFGGSQCARLRETVMCWDERLTGSRFLRGMNTIGGVTRDSDAETLDELRKFLKLLHKDFKEIMSIADNSISLINRLKETGVLDQQIGIDHGVVGVVGRAIGKTLDARIDFPYAAYSECSFAVATEHSGDVDARFRVRVAELYSSIDIITSLLEKISEGEICAAFDELPLEKNALSISIVEGWRGDVVVAVQTDSKGEVSRVSVRDASLLNWAAVPHAVKGNMVPDFPLINKSFDLSYSGYDR